MDPRERAQHLRLRRRQERQLEREGQHELPNRHRWQDAVDEVRRLRRHSPPRAARAEAAMGSTVRIDFIDRIFWSAVISVAPCVSAVATMHLSPGSPCMARRAAVIAITPSVGTSETLVRSTTSRASETLIPSRMRPASASASSSQNVIVETCAPRAGERACRAAANPAPATPGLACREGALHPTLAGAHRPLGQGAGRSLRRRSRALPSSSPAPDGARRLPARASRQSCRAW